ncbi:hypothetical protein C5S31_03350 [ANME-1 cluster archaeon GoMg2]|nr:hypothetical protein [ANME-1 cluster archaeon GoMg2]
MSCLVCECGYIATNVEELHKHQAKCAVFQAKQTGEGRNAIIEALGDKPTSERESDSRAVNVHTT